MKRFYNLYADKLMNITVVDSKVKEIFEERIGKHYVGDYGKVKKTQKR